MVALGGWEFLMNKVLLQDEPASLGPLIWLDLHSVLTPPPL